MPTDLPVSPSTTTPEAASGQPLVQPAAAALRWAVVDLMGHKCIAGAVSLEDLGDKRLVRVDVPEVVMPNRTIPAHAQSFGAVAIFSIAWCDEAAALAAAQLIQHMPPDAHAINQGTQEANHASA